MEFRTQVYRTIGAVFFSLVLVLGVGCKPSSDTSQLMDLNEMVGGERLAGTCEGDYQVQPGMLLTIEDAKRESQQHGRQVMRQALSAIPDMMQMTVNKLVSIHMRKNALAACDRKSSDIGQQSSCVMPGDSDFGRAYSMYLPTNDEAIRRSVPKLYGYIFAKAMALAVEEGATAEIVNYAQKMKKVTRALVGTVRSDFAKLGLQPAFDEAARRLSQYDSELESVVFSEAVDSFYCTDAGRVAMARRFPKTFQLMQALHKEMFLPMEAATSLSLAQPIDYQWISPHAEDRTPEQQRRWEENQKILNNAVGTPLANLRDKHKIIEAMYQNGSMTMTREDMDEYYNRRSLSQSVDRNSGEEWLKEHFPLTASTEQQFGFKQDELLATEWAFRANHERYTRNDDGRDAADPFWAHKNLKGMIRQTSGYQHDQNAALYAVEKTADKMIKVNPFVDFVANDYVGSYIDYGKQQQQKLIDQSNQYFRDNADDLYPVSSGQPEKKEIPYNNDWTAPLQVYTPSSQTNVNLPGMQEAPALWDISNDGSIQLNSPGGYENLDLGEPQGF